MIDYIFNFPSEQKAINFFETFKSQVTSVTPYNPLDINNITGYDSEQSKFIWDTSRTVPQINPDGSFTILVTTDKLYKIFIDKADWYEDRDTPSKKAILQTNLKIGYPECVEYRSKEKSVAE